jgi:probable HAF family extracellular repeat protein
LKRWQQTADENPVLAFAYCTFVGAAGEATMRIRHCLSILVLGMWVLQLLDPPTPGAAQFYSIQDVNVGDAVKAVGPNLTNQSAVRSGFVDAKSFRSTPDATSGATTGLTGGTTNDDLGLLPGGDHFTANGINDDGDVVGSTNISFGSRPCRPNIPGGPPSGNCPISAVRAVIATKTGGLQDLGTLPGDAASEAFGINKPGAVVGYSSGPAGTRAFLWTKKDGMQDLGTLPGGDFSKARAINDDGLVVGISGSPAGTHAVLWDPGKGILDLDTLPGDNTSEALAISKSGSVIGHSRGPAGTRAFLWTSQKGMQELPALPGGSVTRALGINEKGEVVGTSGSFDGGHAVFWNTQGEAQDLNTHVSAPAGTVLFEAVGINASGQIMALGGDESNPHGFHEGSNRAFLLMPVVP